MIKQQEEMIARELDIYLGKKVKDFREQAGWTLTELADRMGIPHHHVHKYEVAETRLTASTLYKLSQLFKTNLRSFFDGFVPHGKT